MKTRPASRMAKAAARPMRGAAAVKSVTREEIDRYWRMKRMEEEEHLIAALKAAARIRARSLSEEDYRRFEESLMEVIKRANEGRDGDGNNNKELQVGIKDWWTKSKYAYLNQPAATNKSLVNEDGSNTPNYIPYKLCSCSPATTVYVGSSLGVF